jgi:ATP-dependent DNA helicase RecQ
MNNIFFEIKGNKSGFNYYALFYYYSKKDFPTLPKDPQLNRELVWDFKDGNFSVDVAKIMSDAIKKLRTRGLKTTNYTACVIPASTSKKTKIRFQDFILEVCNFLEIENGYTFIQVVKDHEQTKGSSSKDILQYLKFNKEKIRNKSILLFDDVITSGQSFVQCANQLKKNGAKDVVGIFLGKTYSVFKHGEPEWMKKNEDVEEIEKLSPTYNETYKLLQDGCNIVEMAEIRGFTEGTIIKHIIVLCDYLDINKFHVIKPDSNVIKRVKAAIFITREKEKLTPIFDHLKGEISYNEIKLAKLFM